jgi:hypothetical protein
MFNSSNSSQFYINSQILINQNLIFLNQLNILNTHKTSIFRRKKEELKIENIVDNRQEELEKLSNINNKLKDKIEVFDNKTNKIIEINSFNVVNNFKKNLLDNRFISHILGKENFVDSLFITLTTKKTNLEDEIEELEEMFVGIKKILKKHKIKHCKVYELTKKLVPHIHLLVFSQDVFNEINEFLKNFNNRTQILKVEKNDIPKIVNYCSKNINSIDKSLIGFNQFLKSKKIKLFSSSLSKSFEKKQRRLLFVAYKIHLEYAKKNKKFISEDFIDFCFKYVKNPLKGFNLHLKNSIPHFYIVKQKIFHSTNLQVFSRFSRISKNDKKSIEKTHKFIIDFSLMLLQKTIEKIENCFVNLFNFYYLHIINYIVNYKIIIIKPPP